MKILLTGGKGQLGRAFVSLTSDPDYKEHSFIAYDLEEMNILDAPQVFKTISGLKPDVVVHAAAYTQVDKAESDQDSAYRLNVIGTQNVAAACLENNLKMVYVSTDYVFDGCNDEPYTEFDQVNPLSVYGKTKLLGEKMAFQINPRLFIVRTAWLYGDGNNFVKTMLRLSKERSYLKVVNDQFGTPTYTLDLAKGIMSIVNTCHYGLYHMTNNGRTTWYEFAKEIFRLAEIKTVVEPITTEEYPTPAARPKNSVLENYMLKLTGRYQFRNWTEALADYLKDIKI